MNEYATYTHNGFSIKVYEDDLKCPLTKELYKEPVVVSSGETFEKQALIDYSHGKVNIRCPVSGLPLNTDGNGCATFYRNILLKYIIDNKSQSSITASINDFLCPISMEPLQIPLIFKNNATYSKNSIDKNFDAQIENHRNIRLPLGGISLGFPNNIINKILRRSPIREPMFDNILDTKYAKIINHIYENNVEELFNECKKQKIEITTPLTQDNILIPHVAAYYDKPIIILKCKEKKFDFNTTTNNGMQTVHFAASGNSVSSLNLLFSRGVDLNAKTSIGDLSALHIAATKGNLAALKYICEHAANFDINSRCFGNKTALMLAATVSLPCALYLLSKGASSHLTDSEGSNILHYLPQNMKLETNLLNGVLKDINFNTTAICNSQKVNPYHIAIMNNNMHFLLTFHVKVRLLPNYKDAVNQKNINGFTPIFFAILNGLPHMAQYLLAIGADPNIKCSRGYDAVLGCAVFDKPDILNIFLNHNCSIAAIINHQSILDVAIDNKKDVIIDILKNLTQDQNSDKFNILHLCALSYTNENKLCELISSLDNLNELIEQENKDGITALQYLNDNQKYLLINKIRSKVRATSDTITSPLSKNTLT